MKTKELIKYLQEFDAESEVVVIAANGSCGATIQVHFLPVETQKTFGSQSEECLTGTATISFRPISRRSMTR